MKRVALALLLLVPGVALAFDDTPSAPRVGVLRQAELAEFEGDAVVSDTVLRHLRDELRERGVDAFDVDLTYDEAVEENFADADFLIEIAGAWGDGADHGGIGVGGRHGGVGVSISVARVAAELRVYDGRTFQLLATEHLQGRNRSVLPSSISLGGRSFWLGVAVPIAQTVQMRRVARNVARDAASRVTAVLAER